MYMKNKTVPSSHLHVKIRVSHLWHLGAFRENLIVTIPFGNNWKLDSKLSTYNCILLNSNKLWRNTLLSVVKQEMTGWATGESTWKQIVSKLSGSIRRWGNQIKWFWSKSVRRVEPLHVSVQSNLQLYHRFLYLRWFLRHKCCWTIFVKIWMFPTKHCFKKIIQYKG